MSWMLRWFSFCHVTVEAHGNFCLQVFSFPIFRKLKSNQGQPAGTQTDRAVGLQSLGDRCYWSIREQTPSSPHVILHTLSVVGSASWCSHPKETADEAYNVTREAIHRGKIQSVCSVHLWVMEMKKTATLATQDQIIISCQLGHMSPCQPFIIDMYLFLVMLVSKNETVQLLRHSKNWRK